MALCLQLHTVGSWFLSILRFWLAIMCKVCILPETNLPKTTLLLHIKSVLESRFGLEVLYPARCFLLFYTFILSIQFIIWNHSTTCHIISTLNSMLHNKQYTICVTVFIVFHTETGSHCRLDIHLQTFWRSFQLSSSVRHRDRVLLTGVTGYVGAFILKELLQNTEVCFIWWLSASTYFVYSPCLLCMFLLWLNRK
jgi:hypothetical protein